MKILACFKIVRDFERITPAELIELRDGNLTISVFKKIFGSYDEAALENARRLAVDARKDGNCTLDAVTVGECEKRFAKNLYALGFDRVFHISGGDVSKEICLLAEREGGYNAILTGRQAWPDERGLTHYRIAKRLSLPCVSHVITLSHCPDGVRVTSGTDHGTFTRTVTVPAVYSMGEAKHPYLKIATLREKLAAEQKAVYQIKATTFENQSHFGEALQLLYETTEKQCRFIDGETADEKAAALWQEVFFP